MKRSPLKRIGKIGKRNIEANKRIAEMWKEKGIYYCEVHLPGCLKNWPLQNCHKNKRDYYYSKPEKLYDYNEVVRACQNCHNLLEHDKKLTEKVFNDLRPL